MRRVALWWLLLGGLVVGAWALAAPASFYDDFGLSQPWIATDGVFNEHLIRDVGALNLALAVLTFMALGAADRRLDRPVAIAWLVYGIPHLAYHATHTAPFVPLDAVSQVAALATYVVAPLVLLLQRRPSVPPPSA